MHRDIALEIMDAIKRLDLIIVELDEISKRIPDETERKTLRRATIGVVGHIYEHVIRGVIGQYPDLDPDKIHSAAP